MRRWPARLIWALLIVAVGFLALGLGPSRGGGSARADAACILCKPTTTTSSPPPPPVTTTTTQPPVSGPTTTVAPTTTTTREATTTVPPAPKLDATFLPCAPPPRGGACTQDPSLVKVVWPADKAFQGAVLTWSPGAGRPAHAAAPEAGTKPVVLPGSAAVACPKSTPAPTGSVAVCWSWPGALTYSQTTKAQATHAQATNSPTTTAPTKSAPTKATTWILDGMYSVAPCTGNPCAAVKSWQPARIGVAVPPKPPRSVQAGTSGGVVVISWMPANPVEPDLFGYAVTRNGQEIYACTVQAAGIGGEQACSAGLSTQDQPPTGTWSYRVTALRFGVDSQLGEIVPSAATGSPSSTVHYQLPPGVAPESSGSGGIIDVPGLVLPATPFGDIAPPATSAADPDSGALAGAPSGPASAQLPYGDTADPAAATGAREDGPAKPNPVPVGMVALAIIALALAAHVVYLRAELGWAGRAGSSDRRRRRRPVGAHSKV